MNIKITHHNNESTPPAVANTVKSKRGFFFIFICFLTAHILLISTTRLFPFLDMPNHLAIATIYKSYGDSANQFEKFFYIDLFPKPNVFHVVFCGSQLFPTVEIANRIFYCLYAVLFSLAGFLVIKRVHGNPWFCLLPFLLLYNINVSYGFTGFTISIPFVLLTFYVILDYLDHPNPYNVIALSVLFAALFFMHACGILFCLFIFFFCLYRKHQSLKLFLYKCLPAVPSLIIFAIWWLRDSAEYSGRDMTGFLFEYYTHDYIKSFFTRGGFLIHDNFRLYGGPTGYTIAALFSLFIIGFFGYGFLRNKQPLKTLVSTAHGKALCIFAACSLSCVLFMPVQLPGYSFLFQRFSVYLLLSIIFSGSILFAEQLHRLAAASICVVCFIHLLLWADCFKDFQNENRLFNESFFPAKAQNKKIGALVYDFRFRKMSVYDNFADYFVVWKNGITSSRIFDARSFPIRRKSGTNALPEFIEWVGKLNNYDGRYEEMDYILVRGSPPAEAKKYLKHFSIVKTADKWFLYKKTEPPLTF